MTETAHPYAVTRTKLSDGTQKPYTAIVHPFPCSDCDDGTVWYCRRHSNGNCPCARAGMKCEVCAGTGTVLIEFMHPRAASHDDCVACQAAAFNAGLLTEADLDAPVLALLAHWREVEAEARRNHGHAYDTERGAA